MLKKYIVQRIQELLDGATLDTATEVHVTVSSSVRKPYSKDKEKVELANFTIKIPSNIK